MPPAIELTPISRAIEVMARQAAPFDEARAAAAKNLPPAAARGHRRQNREVRAATARRGRPAPPRLVQTSALRPGLLHRLRRQDAAWRERGDRTGAVRKRAWGDRARRQGARARGGMAGLHHQGPPPLEIASKTARCSRSCLRHGGPEGPHGLKQRQRVGGLQIDDLAALQHRARLGDRDAPRRDVFVLVRLVRRIGRRRRADPRRGRRSAPRRRSRAPDTGAEPLDACGTQPISSSHSRRAACFGRLASFDAAGRKLPRLAIERRAVLPDDHDAAVVLRSGSARPTAGAARSRPRAPARSESAACSTSTENTRPLKTVS